MPYKQIGNLNIFYEEFGMGEPIIFLHSGYSRGILAFGAQILPLLLIAGENDTFATKERLENIKKYCPQAEIFIVRGCGHAPHFPTENVKEVNEKMLSFIRTVK